MVICGSLSDNDQDIVRDYEVRSVVSKQSGRVRREKARPAALFDPYCVSDLTANPSLRSDPGRGSRGRQAAVIQLRSGDRVAIDLPVNCPRRDGLRVAWTEASTGECVDGTTMSTTVPQLSQM